MGLMWTMLMCALWSCLVLLNFSWGSDYGSETSGTKVLQDGVPEPRGRHRLQLLFPLLLRISTRLATLVSTALAGLFGIILFVVFSKKALIISLLALFLTLSSKFKAKSEDIYIHKVNSYPDYNDEEHVHYYHQGPSKYKKNSNEDYSANKKWKKNFKRTISSFSHIPSAPLQSFHNNVRLFKLLPKFSKRAESMENHAMPFLYPPVSESQNLSLSEVWDDQKLDSLK